MDIKLKSEKPTDITIDHNDFFDLLEKIVPENSIVQIGKAKRNIYRYWLKDAIKLKAYTGRRNSELFNMCWNMIHFDGNKPLYIISPNDKVNNLQNNVRDEDKMYTYVPIIDELL